MMESNVPQQNVKPYTVLPLNFWSGIRSSFDASSSLTGSERAKESQQ